MNALSYAFRRALSAYRAHPWAMAADACIVAAIMIWIAL